MSPKLRYQQLIPYNSTHQCPLHFQLHNLHTLSHSSSVAAVTMSRAGRQVSRGSIPENSRRSSQLPGMHQRGLQPIYTKETGAFVWGLKRPGREADHSFQKTLLRGLNCMALHLHFSLRLHDAVLIRHRDILNFVIYRKLQNIDQNMRLLDSVEFPRYLYEFTDTNLMEFESADAFLYLDSPRDSL